MISLEGRKALITGGSRGIGRATAILFARAGSDIAINYASKREEAEKVKARVEMIGKECLVFKVDISKKDEIDDMVEKCIERWSKIDILVNNAGIWTYGEIGNMNEEVWAKTMRINCDGAFFTCNVVVPYMKEKK